MKIPVHRYILAVNFERRDLTRGQRASISAWTRKWIIAQQNAERKLSGKSADGTAGGRGRKNLTAKSLEGFSERVARETPSQIAADAKASQYKAKQAIAVQQADPELAKQVTTGAVPLGPSTRAAVGTFSRQRGK